MFLGNLRVVRNSFNKCDASRLILLNLDFHMPPRSFAGIRIHSLGSRFAQIILAAVLANFGRHVANDYHRVSALQCDRGGAGVGLPASQNIF